MTLVEFVFAVNAVIAAITAFTMQFLKKNFLFSCLILASLGLVSCKVIEINEDNWDQLLDGKEYMVELLVFDLYLRFFFVLT